MKAPQSYRLDGVDQTTRVNFLTRVTQLLAYGPFRKGQGRNAVIIWRDGEEPTITSRADFAAWLRANGLEAQARECMHRRVPPAHVLCWLEVDREDVASVGFALIDYATEVQSVLATQSNS